MPAARSRSRTEEAQPKPRADAYVGLLGISLLALIAAMVFAFLNWDGIKEKPKPVPTSPPAGAPRMPAGPGPNVGTPPQMRPGNVQPPAGAPKAPTPSAPPQKK